MIHALRHGLRDYRPPDIDGDYPDAAVAVPITRDRRDPELLLTRRAMHLRLHKGEVAFPGGKADPEDRDSLHTATREMEEEIGLPPGKFEVLGRLRQRLSRTGIRVTPWVGLIEPEQQLRLNRSELDAAFKVPLEYLCEPRHLKIEHLRHEGEDITIASYHYEDYVIWGMTALIIADLANTFFDADLPVRIDRR